MKQCQQTISFVHIRRAATTNGPDAAFNASCASSRVNPPKIQDITFHQRLKQLGKEIKAAAADHI